MNLKEMCKSLRLAYVAEIYESIPMESPESFLTELFASEMRMREEAKAERLIKKARFINHKTLDLFRWNESIYFPKQMEKEKLCTLGFIEHKQNVVLTGAPGTGKTHLAIGLGRQACEKGYEVRFFRISELVEQLTKSWRDGKLNAFQSRLDTADLIILDEMGYIPLTKESAELLFQLITHWYEQKSIIITSNLEFSQWNRIFSDARLTAALVDRVIHHAHILTFTGDSYRVTHALSRN
ncbi:IS21-like element helper ATPase IstB [Shouchella miscanthi]|uniref:IS21-like element helper ATPase IstB n=1 Tax=Shouchella miscanthi TaxID=2598861 RepID=A0ABU6NP26_9BACI|nr:IS21-like element helper ATPase IstB [Shouchella miscanthi]MED4129955.1 IS21-like element helper ATPase IstB [Shouchella miscanthi]